MPIPIFLLAAWILSATPLPLAVVADIELTDSNREAWREHIMPTEQELQFFQIPWKTTLTAGVLRANELGKPVLLWTMNGHPLGCT